MAIAATPDLLHLVGYLTGAALYAMLLAMVLRGTARPDAFVVATALLGLAWNVGELLMLAGLAAGAHDVAAWLAALAYTALGFLAAVVIHSVGRGGEEGPGHLLRMVPAGAYGSAALAGVLHLSAAATGAPLPSPLALEIVTGGLVLLSLVLAVANRRLDQARTAVWLIPLAIFAISALHLGRFHGAHDSWLAELLGHHASIPLAFAMLYRDYRFALADLFLKQALTLLALVAIILGLYAVHVAVRPRFDPGAPAGVTLMLAAWVGTALLYPSLRRVIGRFVDVVMLSRANYAELVDVLATDLQACRTADEVAAACSAALTPALHAREVSWRAEPVRPGPPLAANEVPVWTTDAPQYVLRVGELAGGRRLLSDDATMLERVATMAARRIDALRLTEERYARVLREREMRALATEAELRALRAQVNPHFLFNALTTIGYLIQSAPPRALETLLRLTTLLRGVLRTDGTLTTLGREQELVECYLEIEQARFEERLAFDIDVPSGLEGAAIPPLILQPLVENAIKHGIARARAGGSIHVSARANGGTLDLSVRNTGARLDANRPPDLGIGLASIERRLACHYGDAARCSIETLGDGSTLATVRLPLAISRQGDARAAAARRGEVA
jgi:two-component system, LytTR family, sensor kinase